MIVSSLGVGAQGKPYAMNGANFAAKETEGAQKLQPDSRLSIDRAFESASIGVDNFVAADMKARILEANDAQNYIDRALILRTQSSQALSKESVEEAVVALNLILASRGEPPISPSEERLLANRIYGALKQRIAFLGAFANAMEGETIQIKA
jgi:hypothetical protein